MKKQIGVKILQENHDAITYSKLGRTKGESLDCVINMYKDSKFAVVKITNTRNNKVFLYIEDTDVLYSKNYKMIISNGEYPISYDVNNYGWQVFTIEIIGNFSEAKHANFFMLHASNLLIDSGVYLYNDEILSGKYTKFIYVPVKIETYEKILNYCIKNKIKYKKLVNKLISKFFLSETEI